MRAAYARASGVTALAGGLLLIAGASPVPWAADGTTALQVTGVNSTGTTVEVTLLNSATNLATGRVVLEVRIKGRTTTTEVPFVVWGGQKVFVQWIAPGPVEQVRPVSIIVDDGAPL